MRYARQTKILEIIKNEEISTQEELAERLKEEGFNATQATVSRDIKELGLVKVSGRIKKSRYADAPKVPERILDKYGKILTDTIVSVKSSENLIIIKTLSGCAGAAAEVIDRVPDDSILGTIAGDNTILLIVDSKEHVEMVTNMIKEVIS